MLNFKFKVSVALSFCCCGFFFSDEVFYRYRFYYLGVDRLGTIYYLTKKSWHLRAIWVPQSFSEGNLGSAKFLKPFWVPRAQKG